MAVVVEGPERPAVLPELAGVALTSPGVSFELRVVCSQCGLTYLESDIRRHQGKAYCVSGGCAADIPRLMRRGK